MKLLFIAQDFPSPLDRNCGIFNQYLVRAIAQQHEVRVICPVQWIGALKHGRKGAAEIAEASGVPVDYPLYFYTPKMLRNQYGNFMWRSVKGTVNRILKTWRPDAVIGYWVHPDGYVADRIARQLNIPSGVIVGGSDVLLLTEDESRRQQVQDVLRNVDVVFAVNEHLKERVEQMGIDGRKVHVWSQGVDDRFCPGDQLVAREKLNIPDVPTMVWVGRLVPVKGLEVLIEAARILKQAMDFKLHLVGEGPLRGALEAQVAAAGLKDHVNFAGLQEHDTLPDWYRAADLTVLSSHSEGLPNVLRESLACGTPFVSTRVGGIHEIAGDRADDWLVKAGEPVALAGALQRCLTTPQAMPSGFRVLRWSDSARRMMDTMRAVRKELAQNALGVRKPRSIRQFARKVIAKVLPSRVFLHGPPNSGKACLTFDDGPHPVHTPRLLDILRQTETRATFFVVGKHAERYPEIIRRMVEEGHTVGHHTYTHGEPSTTSAAVLMREVNQTCDLLMPLVGEALKLFRPPHGKLTAGKLLRLWGAGQSIILWDLDPKDYACQSADELSERLKRFPPTGGNIVLLHDSLPHAAVVLPEVIESAEARGGVYDGSGVGLMTSTLYMANSGRRGAMSGHPAATSGAAEANSGGEKGAQSDHFGQALSGQSIICFAKDWSEHPTSNNHVMRELAKKNKVLWLNSVATRTPNLTSGRDLKKIFRKLASFFRGAKKVDENLWVYSPIVIPLPHSAWATKLNRMILRATLRFLRWKLGMGKFQLWTFLPNTGPYVGTLGETASVYYCVDEWSKFGYLDEGKTAQAEKELCEKVDVVFASAQTLVDRRKGWNKHTYLSRHGVDHALFAQAFDAKTTVPADLERVRTVQGGEAGQTQRPVIGFYGTLQDWVDQDLIVYLAERHPEWSIVLLGRALTDVSKLEKCSNVHLLGAKEHHELPLYCRGFSVGIIPYAQIERISHVNPLKLREYLCAGLPVVTIPMPEVMPLAEWVKICGDYAGFEQAIVESLATDNPQARRERSDAMRGESWAARVDGIGRVVMGVVVRH